MERKQRTIKYSQSCHGIGLHTGVETMITFHPAYLLRQADQKKYSWADLKKIRKKIDELNIKI